MLSTPFRTDRELFCLFHIYYIPNHIVGAMISEFDLSDVHRGFELGVRVQFLPLGFVNFHLQHFGESNDFYQTSIAFYFINMQVLHSLDILKQEDIYDI
jgi:hypothetical protein